VTIKYLKKFSRAIIENSSFTGGSKIVFGNTIKDNFNETRRGGLGGGDGMFGGETKEGSGGEVEEGSQEHRRVFY
jgi:hypothetical protein